MKSLRLLLAAALLASLVQPTFAAEAAARIVQLQNPLQSTGIRIGDVMERKVVLEAPAPYQLSRSALPAKGSNRNGIELAEVQIETQPHGNSNRYAVTLRYQVFAHAAAPSVMVLPEEQFALTGGPTGLAVKIPEWRFWYAPLAVADLSTAKDNLQPQFAPPRLSTEAHWARLYGYAALLVLGALGLAWFNADGRWLPFMNGPFAQAHRRIKRLPADGQSWKQALATLHDAFNRVHGHNLFAAEIGEFVAQHPRYAPARSNIEAFFAQSGHALFSQPPQDNRAFLGQLVTLSKLLRDCERRGA
jgi:mxaA protein